MTMTDREINKRIAEFMGWKNLAWKDAGLEHWTHWPAGWYGDGPTGECYLTSDYINSVDDLIPVLEKLRADGKNLAVTMCGRKQYAADIWDAKDRLLGEGVADSMAMAICHAVMTFLGERRNDKEGT